MQENLAPFVPEAYGPAPDAAADPKRLHMTSCFASRVPTGRIPGSSSADVRAKSAQQTAKGAARCASKAAEPCTGDARERPSEPRQPWASFRAEDALCAALEDEIHDLADARGTAHDRGERRHAQDDGRFQYRVMRKVQSSKVPGAGARARPAAKPSRVAAGGRAGAGWSDSDSELGEIEDTANQLEEQLSWWRKQMETLACRDESRAGSESGAVPGSSDGPRGDDAELIGHSEWLQMPLPDDSARQAAERAAVDALQGAALTVADSEAPRQLPAFDPAPRSRGDLRSQCPLDVHRGMPPAILQQSDRGAGIEPGCSPSPPSGVPAVRAAGGTQQQAAGLWETSLSKLISQQAAELAALGSAADRCAAPPSGQLEVGCKGGGLASSAPSTQASSRTCTRSTPQAFSSLDAVDYGYKGQDLELDDSAAQSGAPGRRRLHCSGLTTPDEIDWPVQVGAGHDGAERGPAAGRGVEGRAQAPAADPQWEGIDAEGSADGDPSSYEDPREAEAAAEAAAALELARDWAAQLAGCAGGAAAQELYVTRQHRCGAPARDPPLALSAASRSWQAELAGAQGGSAFSGAPGLGRCGFGGPAAPSRYRYACPTPSTPMVAGDIAVTVPQVEVRSFGELRDL